ncbi:hypothetical protein [Limnoraphis robusta]|uniref:Uncharacterized protein n=1 Tax=Limnoraphis robusta CCNP1315 TaxID=3110306 RepID=A0ABU5TUM9_9CYAN|nr:hypothetical protein [Limnoraphis robusta]MEA5517708.1 hypothetical protein [Limnoraphis robusta CCNP1315]MEA5546259.1 hypothetical protein [Limnoraphis robusta CCNP1324]
MASSGYEFSTSQNELIGDLAKKMNFVATLLIAIGILGIFLGIINIFNALSASEKTAIVLNNLIQGVFSVLVGTWTKNAAKAFTQIVTTAGTDIENLMIALGELRKLYTLQYWLAIIALVFSVIVLIIILITVVIAVSS